MTAYMIAEMTVRPGPDLDSYRRLAGAAIAKHGGTFMVRGPKVLSETPDDPFTTVVVVAFPDADTALGWYRSEDYAQALGLRDAAMVRRLSIVDGVPA